MSSSSRHTAEEQRKTMAIVKLLLASAVLVAGLQVIYGHGMVMDPVNRSSAWKKGFKTPVNYDDNEIYCGGISVQHEQNGGKCGVCGDNYALNRPRPNENGGEYGTGTIVETYKSGQKFTATVYIDANHLGYFRFSVCPLSRPDELETEECFDKHPLKLADGSDQFQLKAGVTGDVNIDLVLPEGLTCEHCVFRWHWKVANNWGQCGGGREGMGCGPQEHWRTCSDIAIE
ncbi:uncharacterized protein LOC103316982 [Nasonia vitripennis]|uniref:Chitin-binding type-4 domain-containing protein n=1 Tax=Nasonia vitripennis TaxID=7425 RepID=A0A7M7H8E6_NASVI|nr:uncharacterized protein LOC103316982 [Nasonia vitripennis]